LTTGCDRAPACRSASEELLPFRSHYKTHHPAPAARVHPRGGVPLQARAASTVTVTDQADSNWAGYVVASSATKKTSFSAVSGSWTQPAANWAAGFPSDSAFWVGLGG